MSTPATTSSSTNMAVVAVQSNSLATDQFISYPTVLEIYARDRLEQFMKEGLQHLINVLAERYPHHFSRIAANFDEWYLAFDCVLQYIFLRAHNSTFAECFYRIRRVQSATGQSLNYRQIILSVLTTSIAPYLYKRIRQWEAELASPTFGTVQSPSSSVMQQILTSMFPRLRVHWPTLARQSFAVFDSTWGIGNTIQKIRYASGNSKSLDLLMPLLGLQVVHSEPVTNNYLAYGTLAIEQIMTFGSLSLRMIDVWYSRQQLAACPPPPPPPPAVRICFFFQILFDHI